MVLTQFRMVNRLFTVFHICFVIGVHVHTTMSLHSTTLPDEEEHGLTSFYFPTDNGSYITAYLHGGPRIIPEDSDIRFLLYTKNNYNKPNRLFIDDALSWRKSEWDPDADVLVTFHGFHSDSTQGPQPLIKNAVLKYKYTSTNMVVVDWSLLSAAPFYDSAVMNSRPVGRFTGMLLVNMIEARLTHPSRIHIIGHSLGAHVASYCADYIQLMTGMRPWRVTGLDPALPLFETAGPSDRIDKEDAEFVDIVHTNGGSFLEGGLAFVKPLGDVDFYPNGGMKQPGCESEFIPSCSHARSYQFWAESFINNAFVACSCKDWRQFKDSECGCPRPVFMGYFTHPRAQGSYYLSTKANSPYAFGYTS